MRVGQNPAKSIEHVHHPRNVTVAIITYIPFLSGYYRQALDVLKVCLNSILSNTDRPFDLMVFDNASCKETVDYLAGMQGEGKIQYLILSDRNVGKVGAWNVIFGAAPGEYIAYSDFDAYYYPGWLSKHLEVFEAFPEAATVCGLPHRDRRDLCSNTLAIAAQLPGVDVERGKYIPDEWIIEHARSLGKLEGVDSYLQEDDYRIRRGEISGYATAAHFQFMVRKELIKELIPFKYDRPMGASVAEFDHAVNTGPWIRLAVAERVVQHIGNTPDMEVLAALPTPVGNQKERTAGQGRKSSGVLQWKPVRWALMRLYDWVFRQYYSQKS